MIATQTNAGNYAAAIAVFDAVLGGERLPERPGERWPRSLEDGEADRRWARCGCCWGDRGGVVGSVESDAP